jgi:hypothetical protein
LEKVQKGRNSGEIIRGRGIMVNCGGEVEMFDEKWVTGDERLEEYRMVGKYCRDGEDIGEK